MKVINQKLFVIDVKIQDKYYYLVVLIVNLPGNVSNAKGIENVFIAEGKAFSILMLNHLKKI
jgi:hypothetical protein